MVKKILASFSKALGVIVILIFCGFSVLISVMFRDLDFDHMKQTFSYASSIENIFYDERMRFLLGQTKRSPSPHMILVKVDDYSLQNIGSFPFSRTVWADFIKKMNTFQAKVLAFDVLFPEPAPVCGGNSPDETLNNAIKEFQDNGQQKVILTYATAQNQDDAYPEIPESLYEFMADSKQIVNADLKNKLVGKYTFPIPKLLENTPGLAYISTEEDSDGVFRYYPLITNFNGVYLPSFSLLAYKYQTENEYSLQITGADNALLTFAKDQTILLNNNGELKIRFYGGTESFHHISLIDVLKAKDGDPKFINLFKNKTVFVGSTAVGAHDLRHTPIDSKLPGVYFHMNMLHMLEHKYFYQDVNLSIKYSLILMGVGAVITLLAQLFNMAWLDLLVFFSLTIGTLVLDYKKFLPEGYELKLFFILLSNAALYSWNTFLNFSKTNKEKKMIKGTFARYVAPSIVNDMLDNPEKLKVGGEKKDITCLFSDVRDFTSISEKLTPTQLSSALNRYMGQMTDIIFDTSGTLDKYIGDAIVAYWGAPLDVENHPQKAVEASIKMMDALPLINEEFKQKGLPEFKIGIGLNSGECSVGNMGSDKIFSYTALGDNMNLGARLESLSKYYGAQIVISEFTHQRIDLKQIVCRKLDKVIVKGKETPVVIYEVLHNHHFMRKDTMAHALYEKSYQLFSDKKFSESLEHLEQILEKYPEDKASERVAKMCKHYLEHPPETGIDHEITKLTEK